MLKKETQTKEVEAVTAVVCNVCAQPVPDNGCGEEYATLGASWGYDSKKDLQTHEAHICEPCYDALITPLLKIPAYTNDRDVWGNALQGGAS